MDWQKLSKSLLFFIKILIMQQLKFWIFSFVFLLITAPLIGQNITAHTEFHSTKAKKLVNVEEDLYLRFTLDKSLESILMGRGSEEIRTVYGVLKVDFDGVEFLTDAFPIAFAETASIQEFDLALSLVMKEFQALAREQKGNWTGKDNLLINVLGQANNPLNCWMRAVATRAVPNQTHPVKVALYVIGNTKESYSRSASIATGNFEVKVGKDALLPLYGTRIPALYKPVLDNGITDALHQKNVANILWSTQPVLAKEADTKLMKTSFNVEEKEIQGRVYLPKSVRNLAASVGNNKSCTFNLSYYLDGKLVEESKQSLEATVCEKETTLSIPLWSEKGGLNTSLRNRVKELTTGEYKLKVVLDLDYKEGNTARKLPMATSSITLTK
jgi:hypothetical protein